jgi:hypothetical protein
VADGVDFLVSAVSTETPGACWRGRLSWSDMLAMGSWRSVAGELQFLEFSDAWGPRNRVNKCLQGCECLLLVPRDCVGQEKKNRKKDSALSRVMN